MTTLLKYADGHYRPISGLTDVYVWGTGSDWRVVNATTSNIIAQLTNQADAEAALAKLVKSVGAVEL
jgi:hypothetical protein